MRTLVTAVTLLMAGIAVFSWASDGFRVATATGNAPPLPGNLTGFAEINQPGGTNA